MGWRKKFFNLLLWDLDYIKFLFIGIYIYIHLMWFDGIELYLSLA